MECESTQVDWHYWIWQRARAVCSFGELIDDGVLYKILSEGYADTIVTLYFDALTKRFTSRFEVCRRCTGCGTTKKSEKRSCGKEPHGEKSDGTKTTR
jgi:hypothetical protein